jgi:hypothetical protein
MPYLLTILLITKAYKNILLSYLEDLLPRERINKI